MVDRLRHRSAYFWAIVIAYLLIGPTVAIWVNIQNIDRSEKKLCTVVVTTDDVYRNSPPTTEAGIKLAVNFRQLRRDLGCAPYKGE